MRVMLQGKAELAVRQMMDMSGATIDEVIRRALGSHMLLLDEKKRGSVGALGHEEALK